MAPEVVCAATVILLIVAAALSSSIGHGGATSYTAILALTQTSPSQISTSSLLLNLFVAGVGVYRGSRAQTLDFGLALPLILGSVPMAFLAGSLVVHDRTYNALLALVLLSAAITLLSWRASAIVAVSTPSASTRATFGAVIGFIAGVSGVGGGVFITPLAFFRRWATPDRIVALSSLFILCNSLGGLAGRLSRGVPDLSPELPLWFVAVALGTGIALFGKVRLFSRSKFRTLLALVLIIAVMRLSFRAIVLT